MKADVKLAASKELQYLPKQNIALVELIDFPEQNKASPLGGQEISGGGGGIYWEVQAGDQR